MTSQATCAVCGRELVYDASADVESWSHWVEPAGHKAEPVEAVTDLLAEGAP